jgi:CRP-like cAMP-binding protein
MPVTVLVPSGCGCSRLQWRRLTSALPVLSSASHSTRCAVQVLLTGADGTKVVHQYKAGSYFGELALLYDQPRAATVRATAKCKLWVMERAVYNAIYHTEMREVRAAKLALIKSMPIFKPLSESLQNMLCDVLKLQEEPASKALFYKGDEGDLFYVIKSGAVEITIGEKARRPSPCSCIVSCVALHARVVACLMPRIGDILLVISTACGESAAPSCPVHCCVQRNIAARVQVVSTLGPGQYFGERALWKQNNPRAATAITQAPCTFYTLERAHFQRMLGPLDQIWRFEALQRVPILFNLTDAQLLDVAAHLESKAIAPGEVVIKQGEVGDSFYIIEEGTFTCYLDDGTKLALVDRGSCFGELALLHHERRACNVAAERGGGALHTVSLARLRNVCAAVRMSCYPDRGQAFSMPSCVQPCLCLKWHADIMCQACLLANVSVLPCRQATLPCAR